LTNPVFAGPLFSTDFTNNSLSDPGDFYYQGSKFISKSLSLIFKVNFIQNCHGYWISNQRPPERSS
jgi:hypothetical protein